MVYKLTAPEIKKNRLGTLLLVLPYGVLAAMVAAAMGMVMDASMVAVCAASLLAAVVCVLPLYRNMAKNFRLLQGQGDWFVTATEAGLMIEKPAVGATVYYAWGLVDKVLMRKGLLFIWLNNGLKYFLPLYSLSPERARELLAYCAGHARKPVPLEKQVTPPEEMLAAPALPCADGAAARQEVADTMILQRAPIVWWASLFCVAVMVSALVMYAWIWWYTGELEIEGTVVAFVMTLFGIRGILHPGWKMRKWVRQRGRSEAHIHRGMVLVHTPGVAWSMVPVSLVGGGRELRHCYAYAVQGGGVLGIARSVPAPAELPRPVPMKRWRTCLALLLAGVVLPVLVALGMWCWLGQHEESVDDEAGDRGCELAGYVQELLPPGDFPGPIYWGAVFDLPEGGCKIYYLWNNGMELQITLPPLPTDQPDSEPASGGWDESAGE